FIKCVGRPNIRIRNRGAGRREYAWNVRARKTANASEVFRAPCPFAGRDQRNGEQSAEEDAHTGTEPALLDRVANQEEAAECDCHAADPYHPLGAEPFLQGRSSRSRFGRRWWWRRRRGHGRRFRRQGFG